MDRNPRRARPARSVGDSRRASFGAMLALLLTAVASVAPILRAQQPPRPGVADPPTLLQRETLQPAPARLEDFEQTALANPPQLVAAAQAVEVAEGKAWQARLYPNPLVGYGAPQLGGIE